MLNKKIYLYFKYYYNIKILILKNIINILLTNYFKFSSNNSNSDNID